MHHLHDHKDTRWYRGIVRDVFGRRFVLATNEGSILADLGHHAPENVRVKVGAKVNITGTRTASEVKVQMFQRGRGEITVLRKPRKDPPYKESDLVAAANVALDAGYIVEGGPVRKSKHLVVQAIRGGRRYELHIMPNGDIRKEKQLKVSG